MAKAWAGLANEAKSEPRKFLFFFNLAWWTRPAEAGLSDPPVRTLMFYSRKIIPNGGNEFSRLLGCAPALELQFQERFVTTRLHHLKEEKKPFYSVKMEPLMKY